MKIALCRLGPPVTSRENALKRLAKTYLRAVADKAMLVVFPELKMIATETPTEAPREVFLRPHDLKQLARATESVPLLLGGALRARQKQLEDPESARVYALSDGRVQQLAPQLNSSQWLTVAGRPVETLIVGNSWTEVRPWGPWEQPYRRTNDLLRFGAAVGIDFHIDRCPQPSGCLPLQGYWHGIGSTFDPVSGNGLIRGVAGKPEAGLTEPGDMTLLVDLDDLDWPQSSTPLTTAESMPESAGEWGQALTLYGAGAGAKNAADTSLILGCLTQVPLQVGKARIVAQIQRTWRQFRSGMMYREPLADEEGMLFLYSHPQRVSFYMANTPSPLSCAYLDPEGVIREIHDLHPFDLNSIRSKSHAIQYVLEMRQGWFQDHGVVVGQSVLASGAPLAQTFFGA
jgi:uncharacterized membrane protein (UPF0127 family)